MEKKYLDEGKSEDPHPYPPPEYQGRGKETEYSVREKEAEYRGREKEDIGDALLEMRWRCLSLAADLDRLERSGTENSDPRLLKLREAFAVLLEGEPNRAQRVQMIFSDTTSPPAYRKHHRP